MTDRIFCRKKSRLTGACGRLPVALVVMSLKMWVSVGQGRRSITAANSVFQVFMTVPVGVTFGIHQELHFVV